MRAAGGTAERTRPVLVASDLDRTLVYSAAALGLTMPDAEAPRLLCVETYQHQPLSYVTETAARLLTRLTERSASGAGAFLVPVTTRTRAQYARIRLPGPPPRHAVCANGGHLLVDGVSDPDWHARVRRGLGDCAPLTEVRARLNGTGGDRADWVLKERVAEDLFAYLVVDRDRLPAGWIEELAAWADPRGWTVSLQGRKIYAVPRPVSKSAAVAEVARRTGAASVYAAGDSLLDADMLLAADAGWRPGHGELADADWSADHIVALQERGVAAGERLASEMAALAEARSPERGRTDTANRPDRPRQPGPAPAGSTG